MKLNISLKNTILIYLIIFSCFILIFLWLIQIVFLNSSYRLSKINDINNSLINVTEVYKNDNYALELSKISRKNDVCIDLIYKNKTIYTTSSYNENCLGPNEKILNSFKYSFIKDNITSKSVEIINPTYNNKTLVTAKLIDNDTYAFINASLVPMDGSIKILKEQFIYTALAMFFISIWVSYFISRRISKPITVLNDAAKKLGSKDYSVIFPTDDGITEINELATTLNNTTIELGKTDSLRRELLANVSHDLKTPLTMIKAYAEAARDLNSNKKKKREENLNVIIEEVEKLNYLVNDVLELSKIEARAYPLEKKEFNIKDLINTILKRFELFKEKGYSFEFINSFDAIVYADPKKIEQVIYNLINNAINYTGKDKKIIINMKDDEDNVIISIIDTGCGIDDEDINLIWDKYYRTDKHHKRENLGTGLGLSIVKGILESHNFKYGVESIKNKGTTFYFHMKKKK